MFQIEETVRIKEMLSLCKYLDYRFSISKKNINVEHFSKCYLNSLWPKFPNSYSTFSKVLSPRKTIAIKNNDDKLLSSSRSDRDLCECF